MEANTNEYKLITQQQNHPPLTSHEQKPNINNYQTISPGCFTVKRKAVGCTIAVLNACIPACSRYYYKV